MALRVALLGIYHESNTFIDNPTTLADFENGHLLQGESIRLEYASAYHEIGGMLKVMDSEGIEVVPVYFAEATPGGVISSDTYRNLTQQMLLQLAQVDELDGCLVAAHGAAVSEDYRDMDGEWLEQLRQAIGPDIPIVGTLDLHANVSQKMVDATDALVIYKENPHLDQRERGEDAARILVRMLKEDTRVVQYLVQVPLAISIEQQLTDSEPCKSLYLEAELLGRQTGVLAVSVALGFPYADVAEMGTSVLVVTEADAALAKQVANQLGKYIWDNRSNYVGHKISIAEATTQVESAHKPVLLLDMGDNIGGGASGTGLCLAQALNKSGSCRFFCYLHSPSAVEFLQDKVIGKQYSLLLDGFNDIGPTKLAVEVTLERLSNGVFHEENPRHGGQAHYDMGQIAVIRTEGGSVFLLSTLRIPPFSLRQLTSFDINPEQFDVIIAKGVNAPIAAYGPVCRTVIQVDTPGVTQADMTRFTYSHRRVPLFPFEQGRLPATLTIPQEYIKDLPFYTEGPAIDKLGRQFYTNLTGQAIFHFDQDGKSHHWSAARCPNGQAIDTKGYHLVCDSEESSLLCFDQMGQRVSTIAHGSCAGQQLHVPNDVVVDDTGGVYFTDSIRHNGSVFHVSPEGKEYCVATGLDYPNGLALSPSGDILYVAESYANRILQFRKDQDSTWHMEVFANLPANDSGMPIDNLPDGIAFDKHGRLWVAHYGMGALQVLGSDGQWLASVYCGFPLVSNVCFDYQNEQLLVTGGYGEPGPGALIRIDLRTLDMLLYEEERTTN